MRVRVITARLPRFLALATATVVAATLTATASLAVAPAAYAVDPPVSPTTATVVTPGSGPLSVSIVVPLTLDVGATGLLDSTQLAEATDVGGALTLQLDAIAGTSVVVGLDPMIVASIRVLGTSAPVSATDWLARLEALSNETFLLAYADADPVAAADVDALDVLTPMGFDHAIDPADFGPAGTPAPTDGADGTTPGSTPTPTPTTSPGENAPPPLPTTADLLAWTVALDSIAWPAEGTTLTADAAARLAAAGYSDVIVDSSAVTGSDQALVDLGGLRAVTADGNLSELVRRTADASPSTLAPTLAELGAALDAAVAAAPGRTVVATLDRGWWTGGAQLGPALAAVAGSGSAQLVGLSEIVNGPAAEGTLAESTVVDERTAQVTQLVLAERAEHRYLVIAETPLVVEAPRRLALLALLGTGWADSITQWGTATNTFLEESDAIRTAVQIVESTDVFLPGDNADLPVSVSNALAVPVTVNVTITPLRPLLHVPNPTVAVTIDPDSTNRAKIPVQAIVNGDVTVRTTLTAADGTAVGTPQYTKIILQAGWETAGTVVAAVLVVLVFGGGIVRNVLKRRRARSQTAPTGV